MKSGGWTMMDLVKSDDDGEKIKRRRTKGFSGFEI
jgi:hypothetical protein